jgi:sugar lactone lactonase YvrE
MPYALRRGWPLVLSLAILLTCVVWYSATSAAAEPSKTAAPAVVPAKTASPATNACSTAKPAQLSKDAPPKDKASAADAEKKRQEARKKAVEEAQQAYENEKRQLQERLRKDPLWQPSHEQVAVIRVNQDAPESTVSSFCLNKEGNLLVCCGGGNRGQQSCEDPNTAPAKAKKAMPQGAIRLFSAEGKKLGVWQSAVEPQAICIASDGTIYVGGAGKLNKLDPAGKVLLTADSPNVAELPPLPCVPKKKVEAKDKPDEAAEKAKANKIADLQKQLQEAQKEVQKIIQEATKGLNPNDEVEMTALQEKISKPVEKMRDLQEQLMELRTTPEMRAVQLRAQREYKLTISGMAVTDRDLFVACMSAKGYGFAVWRTDRDFSHPKKIVQNLAGCCGQMDIQAHDGDLWVAHNARHKVEHYDRDGKKIASFGKTDRSSADGFGGCCEPKNLRFTATGELLCAESGPPTCVKRFTTDGKFLGVAVIAPWDSGCVRVTTEYQGGQGKFFVLNSGEKTIHVFAKKKDAVALQKTPGPKAN